MSDVKCFLHNWCMQRRLRRFPVYYYVPRDTASHPFTWEVKIGNDAFFGLVGIGAGRNQKLAKTEAALDLCNRLINAGYMTQIELDTKTADPAAWFLNSADELVSKRVDGTSSNKIKNKHGIISKNGIVSGSIAMVNADKKLICDTEAVSSTKAEATESSRMSQDSNTSLAESLEILDRSMSIIEEIQISDDEVDIQTASPGPEILSEDQASFVRRPGFILSEGQFQSKSNPASVSMVTRKLAKRKATKVSPVKANGVSSTTSKKMRRTSSVDFETQDSDVEIIEEKSRSRNSARIKKSSTSFSDTSTKNNDQGPRSPEINTANGQFDEAAYKSKLERLSRDIWEHCERNRQTKEIFDLKMDILNKLSSALNRTSRFSYRLFPVGSTVNRLGSYNSDMDLCLVIYSRDHYDREIVSDDWGFAKKMLYMARNAFFSLRNVRNLHVIPAKVPIVRFVYEERGHSVEVDINCNNLPGIRNTHLLHYYSLADDRFPALALVIKHWAISAGINNAANGTLSSYALVLLVVHYLQYGVLQTYSYARPVLPNLQALFPHFFNSSNDVRSLNLYEPLAIVAEDARSGRPLELGDLLLGFFNYYANYFDFTTSAASIRQAIVIRKDKLPMAKNKSICIEEPFERTNVARAVRREKYEMILNAFEKAYKNLRRKMTLESIGVHLL